MVSNKIKIKKNERLKGLEKKYYKAQKRSFTVALKIIDSGIPENSKKKLSAPKTCDACDVTKNRSHGFFIVIV